MFTSHSKFIGQPKKAELPDFMETASEGGANIRNFTYKGFDDFSAPVVAEVVQTEVKEVMAPVSQPIFTVEDMELAKSLARDEGVTQGRAQAEKDFADGVVAAEVEEEVRIADLLEKINGELAALNAKSGESYKHLADEISGVALAIAKKVCGDVAARAIEDEIGVIIEDLSGKLDEGEVVKIYLNSENIAALNNKFTNASLNKDEKIAVGDFRVEWKNGFAEKNLKKLWKTLEEVCSRHSLIEEVATTIEEKNG